MPIDDIPTDLQIPISGDDVMAEATPALTEPGNLATSMTLLANGAAAAANRRVDGADILSEGLRYMWSIAMTTPTVLAAKGMQIATESGAGRTRAETNRPTETSAAGNTP